MHKEKVGLKTCYKQVDSFHESLEEHQDDDIETMIDTQLKTWTTANHCFVCK